MARQHAVVKQREGHLVRQIRAWGRRHVYSFMSSLGTLYRNRLGTLLTVVVLGIALVLPLGLYVTLKNLSRVEPVSRDLGTISVFLTPEQDQAAARQLRQEWAAWNGIANIRLISPAEAFEEFRQVSGFGAAAQALDINPLPWVLEVTPAALQDDGVPNVAALLERLEQHRGVEFAQYDLKWLQRLQAILVLAQAVVRVLMVLFSLAVVFVVGNTIRLDIENRREEIEVMSLVGATASFVRRPFLYAGLWYSLLGGLLALLILMIAMFYLSRPIEQLVAAYEGSFVLQPLSGSGAAMVLAGSGLLGLIGAGLAVRRHLRTLNIG